MQKDNGGNVKEIPTTPDPHHVNPARDPELQPTKENPRNSQVNQ
jgi:hypothetical protein